MCWKQPLDARWSGLQPPRNQGLETGSGFPTSHSNAGLSWGWDPGFPEPGPGHCPHACATPTLSGSLNEKQSILTVRETSHPPTPYPTLLGRLPLLSFFPLWTLSLSVWHYSGPSELNFQRRVWTSGLPQVQRQIHHRALTICQMLVQVNNHLLNPLSNPKR